MQPILRGFRIDNLRQQLAINLINREISEESARATVIQTLANVRNAYWDLVFAQSAVDVAQRATELADKLVEDNQARVEVGTLAPLDIVQAQAEAATRRQNLAAAEAAAQTAELALKRFIVSGTDDPLWRQTIRPVDLPSLAPPPTDVEGAVRTRARRAHRHASTRARASTRSDINIRYFKDQSMPALDLTASYGAQGLGGPRARSRRQRHRQPGDRRDPSRRLCRRAATCFAALDYPNWNFARHDELSARSAARPTRSTRARGCSATRR